MLKQPQLVLLVVIVLCPIDLGAECIEKRPMKPVKVDGSLCGSVFDTIAGREPGTELLLHNQAGVVAAKVRADSNADFAFPPLPKGKYRIQATGWTITWGNVELKSSNAPTCKQPVTLYVGMSYPDCSGGWVSKNWDFSHFPDGPPPRE